MPQRYKLAAAQKSGGYFTPDSRLLRMYISLSALLTAPNGIVEPGVLAAGAASRFFAWRIFAARAAEVERARIARPTRMFSSNSAPLKWKDAPVRP